MSFGPVLKGLYMNLLKPCFDPTQGIGFKRNHDGLINLFPMKYFGLALVHEKVTENNPMY